MGYKEGQGNKQNPQTFKGWPVSSEVTVRRPAIICLWKEKDALFNVEPILDIWSTLECTKCLHMPWNELIIAWVPGYPIKPLI